jgi:tetratricopeptide (TPR) repeat protein
LDEVGMAETIPSHDSDLNAESEAADWRLAWMAARKSCDSGEGYWKTLALYRSAVCASPPAPRLYAEAGAFASKLCDIFDALTEMREKYRREPQFASAYFPQFAADFGQAAPIRSFVVHCYAAAAGREPSRRDWQLALGDALARAGRTREALQPFRRAVRLDPEDPEPRLRLAQALGHDNALEIASSDVMDDELRIDLDQANVAPRIRWLPRWRAAALGRGRALCARGEVLAGLERYFFISAPAPYPDLDETLSKAGETSPSTLAGYRWRSAIASWIPPALFPLARRGYRAARPLLARLIRPLSHSND